MSPYSACRARLAGPGGRPAPATNASIPSAADTSGPSPASSPPIASGKASSCMLMLAATSAADSRRPSPRSKPASSGSGFALRQGTPASSAKARIGFPMGM